MVFSFHFSVLILCVCAELPQQPVGSAIDTLMFFQQMMVIFKFSYYDSGLLCCKNSLLRLGFIVISR